jgi:nitrogen fixation protein NifB
VRLQSERFLPQMTHCARCRADAVGLIGEEMTAEQHDSIQHFANASLNPAENDARPYVAVATHEGALVNMHLGEADRLAIFGPDPAAPGFYKMIEVRPTPEEGGGDKRWATLANQLRDCRAIVVTAAGPTPQKVLAAHGLKVVEMEGLIDEGLRAIYANQPIPAAMKRRFTSCGSGVTCKGSGTGCS